MAVEYPNITVGLLRRALEAYPEDWTIDFCGLTYYRVKQRDEKHLQLEFNEQVCRLPDGRVEVVDLALQPPAPPPPNLDS